MHYTSTTDDKQASAAPGMRALALAASMLCASGASAMDVDAGDYTALPAGTNLGLLHYQHAERNRLYANGSVAKIGGSQR